MEEPISTKWISNEQLINQYLPLPMEQYFCRKLPTEAPEYIKIKICELLKYFFLCQHSRGKIPFNREVDELWHLWILQTKQYIELMAGLQVENFFHHSSDDYVDEKDNRIIDEEENINHQVSFLVTYSKYFGSLTDESVVFWPTAIHLMDVLDLDVTGLNSYLRTLSDQTKK